MPGLDGPCSGNGPALQMRARSPPSLLTLPLTGPCGQIVAPLIPEKRVVDAPYARQEHRHDDNIRERMGHGHASTLSLIRFARRESVEREQPVALTMLFQLCPLLSMEVIASLRFASSGRPR